MQTKGLVCAILAQSFFYAAGAFAENAATAPISPDEPSLIETASCDEACEPSGGYSENLACGADPCNVPFWFAGTELTYLQVHGDTGGQLTASFSDTTAPGASSVSFLDGKGIEKFAPAPRLWLGRQFGEKWGVVGRFWYLETTDAGFPNTTAPPTGTNFATFDQSDRLRMYTIDLEAQRTAKVSKWTFAGTLGARHASIGMQSQLYSFGVFTTGNFINVMLQNGCSFDGTGGTGSLMARRQIGDSPLSVFLLGRASYLGGQSNSFGRSVGSVASSPSAPLVGAATVSRNHAEAELDIFEYQAGMELDFKLRVLPVNAFFRTAVEYQMWDIDAPPTGGAGFGGTIGELTTNSFARAGVGGADLIGLAIATGFTY